MKPRALQESEPGVVRIEERDERVPERTRGAIGDGRYPALLLKVEIHLCGAYLYPEWSVIVARSLLPLRRARRSMLYSKFAHRPLTNFKEIGSKMSTRDVEGEWRAASYFLAKGPSASLQYLQKDVRTQLFALKAQALDGDCPPGQDGSMAMDPSLRIRQEAWNALSGMSREDAKTRFVDLLSEVLPEWKKWSADHAPRTSSEEKHESEADKLVKAFKARLNSSTSTQFSRL